MKGIFLSCSYLSIAGLIMNIYFNLSPYKFDVSCVFLPGFSILLVIWQNSIVFVDYYLFLPLFIYSIWASKQLSNDSNYTLNPFKYLMTIFLLLSTAIVIRFEKMVLFRQDLHSGYYHTIPKYEKYKNDIIFLTELLNTKYSKHELTDSIYQVNVKYIGSLKQLLREDEIKSDKEFNKNIGLDTLSTFDSLSIYRRFYLTYISYFKCKYSQSTSRFCKWNYGSKDRPDTPSFLHFLYNGEEFGRVINWIIIWCLNLLSIIVVATILVTKIAKKEKKATGGNSA